MVCNCKRGQLKIPSELHQHCLLGACQQCKYQVSNDAVILPRVPRWELLRYMQGSNKTIDLLMITHLFGSYLTQDELMVVLKKKLSVLQQDQQFLDQELEDNDVAGDEVAPS